MGGRGKRGNGGRKGGRKGKGEDNTSAMAACALAHDDVASLVVDDDADTDFGALSFWHDDTFVLKVSVKQEKKRIGIKGGEKKEEE